jgi:hypothetical protein
MTKNTSKAKFATFRQQFRGWVVAFHVRRLS